MFNKRKKTDINPEAIYIRKTGLFASLLRMGLFLLGVMVLLTMLSSQLRTIFNSSKWSTNDTININVVQKYYNETYDSAGNVTGYDGFSFYYRPIALSTQSAGVYSLDPFPTNNYIPANFIKWLYINGEIGDGSSSSNNDFFFGASSFFGSSFFGSSFFFGAMGSSSSNNDFFFGASSFFV